MSLLLALVLALSPALAQTPQRLDGLTAASDTARLETGPRGFTRVRIDSLMGSGVRVDSLGAWPAKIWILEGGSFEFRDLTLRAKDIGGRLIRGAPVRFELQSMIASLGIDRIMGYAPGQARLAVTSILPRRDGTSTAQTFIDIEVYARP